jgi:OPA family glycerol-3-phosphate transporter-like MFS transporter
MDSVLEKPLHSKKYRIRRGLNWFPLGLTYATFYMGRYNLNVSSKTMIDMFHFSKADFGIIATAGFWTYALSVIFNGPLADKIGGKKSILIGAVGASILNLVIGLLFLNEWQTKIIIGMSLLYSVNQYFQSFGALSVVKVNSHWFHVKERGVFGGIFGIMISSGYLLAYTVGGWILSHFPWFYVFIVPSGAIFIMFLIDFFIVKDKPSDAGLEDFNTGDATSNDPDKDKPLNWKYLIAKVFTNPIIITIAIAEFCTGFVRQGLLLWLVPFLSEVHHIERDTFLYNVATLGITIGGIAGGLLCGFLSDKVFQSRRPPVAFIFYMGQIIFILLLGWTTSPTIAAYLVGVCCMWIFGVHGMLSGTASMDFGGTKAAATVAGMLDGIQYLASGLTGFLLGAGLDKFGWGAWTYMIVPFSLIGSLMMLRVWNANPAKGAAH